MSVHSTQHDEILIPILNIFVMLFLASNYRIYKKQTINTFLNATKS